MVGRPQANVGVRQFAVVVRMPAQEVRLEKARRRFGGPEPETRYRFAVLDAEAVPEDGITDA